MDTWLTNWMNEIRFQTLNFILSRKSVKNSIFDPRAAILNYKKNLKLSNRLVFRFK